MKMTMTPDKARELLARNPNNRNMSKKLAQKYAGDMKEGMWLYNGDPIRVSKAGDLLDGQHRLEACVISGMSFDTELIEELDDKIMPTIDNGRRRSAGDAIHILTGGSAQNNAGIAASTRQILNYVCGFAPNQPQSTPAIIRMINRYPEIADAYRLGMRTKGILTPGPLGAVLFLGQRAPTMGDRAVAFVDGIHSGAGLAAGRLSRLSPPGAGLPNRSG